MTETKKTAMTELERQKATLDRLAKSGGKRITVKLSKKTVDVLERVKNDFATQNEAIEYAILNMEQRSLL